MAEIRITLRSDLCAGSGGNAGIRIDSDIATDACGLPYIPARRIKGCLRDAAVELRAMGCPEASDEAIAALFGDGDGRQGSLHTDDAQLPGSVGLRAFLKSDNVPECLRKYAQPAGVIKLFSYVRGNTRMKEGVAEHGSLRFTRVLSHASLFQPGEDAVLISHVRQDEPELNELLRKCCLATRHIGMHRNRGLGAVRMEYITDVDNSTADKPAAVPQQPKQARVELRYRVALNAPLAMNGCGGLLTAIPARSVIGCIAGNYLRAHGSAEDEDFRRLFLSGDAVWSALTPCIGGERSVPAPLMLAQCARSGDCVNRFGADDSWRSEKLRTLEGSYAVEREDGYELARARTRTSYHHRRAASGVSEQLYTQDALESGMLYAGSVILPGELAPLACTLLRESDLRFGHSKNAEYAKCALAGEPEPHSLTADTLRPGAGEPVFAVLESDLACSDGGLYMTSHAAFRSLIARNLGVRDEVPAGFMDCCLSHELSGYHAQWRMQKPRVPAVMGGSVFCFVAGGAPVERCSFLGDYRQEGLGRVRVLTLEEIGRRTQIHWADVDRHEQSEALSVEAACLRSEMTVAAALDAMRDRARQFVEDAGNWKFLSGCPLSRLRLMLSEAGDYGDFLKRVDTIRPSDVSGENRGRAANARDVMARLYGNGAAPALEYLVADAEVRRLVEADERAREQIENDWKLLMEDVLHLTYYRLKRKGA